MDDVKAETEQFLDFPIRIRERVVVRILGLPDDLTLEEADRISGIILAYCSPNDTPVT